MATAPATAGELHALRQFRAQIPVADRDHIDDNALLRIVRARKLDVKECLKMYTAIKTFRSEYKADHIVDLADPLEPIYQHMTPHGFHGFSKAGCPIYVERTGLIRPPEVVKHLREEDLVERHVRSQEQMFMRCEHASVKMGRLIEKQIVIMDMAGLSMKPESIGTRVFRRVLTIDGSYYPERLSKLFIINSSFLFRTVWAVVGAWVDPITKAKIEVIGTDYKARLLEFIDPEQLPREWGGTCVCNPSTGLCLVKQPTPYIAGRIHESVTWRPLEGAPLPDTNSTTSEEKKTTATPLPTATATPTVTEEAKQSTSSTSSSTSSTTDTSEESAVAVASPDTTTATSPEGIAVTFTSSSSTTSSPSTVASSVEGVPSSSPPGGASLAPSAPVAVAAGVATPTKASLPLGGIRPFVLRDLPLNRQWQWSQQRDERWLNQLIEIRRARPLTYSATAKQ